MVRLRWCEMLPVRRAKRQFPAVLAVEESRHRERGADHVVGAAAEEHLLRPATNEAIRVSSVIRC